MAGNDDKPEHKPDDKPAPGKGYEIIVNSQPKLFPRDEITYKEVVELADYELASKVTYVVLWENGGGRQDEGEMSETGPKSKVKIKNGTVFDVTRANRV